MEKVDSIGAATSSSPRLLDYTFACLPTLSSLDRGLMDHFHLRGEVRRKSLQLYTVCGNNTIANWRLNNSVI